MSSAIGLTFSFSLNILVVKVLRRDALHSLLPLQECLQYILNRRQWQRKLNDNGSLKKASLLKCTEHLHFSRR
jgi:hypothetical protein